MLDIVLLHPDDPCVSAAGARRSEIDKPTIFRWRSDLTNGTHPMAVWALRKFGQGNRGRHQNPGTRLAGESGAAESQSGTDAGSPTRLAGYFATLRPRGLAPYWVEPIRTTWRPPNSSKPPRSGRSSPRPTAGRAVSPRAHLVSYCVHLRTIAQPAFVLDISPYWEQKRAAIECYQSQFISGKPTGPPTFIDRLRDQAAYWGWSIGVRYGEPIVIREPIGVTSLDLRLAQHERRGRPWPRLTGGPLGPPYQFACYAEALKLERV